MNCIKLLFFVLTILSYNLSLQSQIINSELVSGINVNDKEVKEIFSLWKNYLASNPDKIYNNPYWNDVEKNKYTSYDLLKSEGFLNPSLYALNPRNMVLYIKRINNGYYKINSIYYWINQNKNLIPLAITNVLAKKEDNTYKLYNFLPYYTSNWEIQKIGMIKYHYRSNYDLDVTKAQSANSFLKKMFYLFDIEPYSIEYYIANNCDDIHQLKGFQYIMSMGNSPNLCAFYDKYNNIVYTTIYSGEFHKHELIHVINSKYSCAHSILLSGLSVYTNSKNSSLGKPFLYHIRKIQKLINSTPNINLTNWDNIDHDFETEPYFFIGAILVHIILEKGGIDLLKEALDFGSTNEDLLDFFLLRLDLNKPELKTILKEKFKEISAKRKMNFLINL